MSRFSSTLFCPAASTVVTTFRRSLLLWLVLVVVDGASAKAVAQQRAHLLSPSEVESTFPATVYFRGKTASVQFRNAAAIQFGQQAVFFAGLIDSSGYASGLQETYQMYLLLEQETHFGGAVLPAGSYGAGFVGSTFTVMNLGGRTIAQGTTTLDEHMTRPRPLQMVQAPDGGVRLYLGRRWVSLSVADN